MKKKTLKIRLDGIMESKIVKTKVNGKVKKTRIPTKEDVAYWLANLLKNPDEDEEFYDLVNFLCDSFTIYYSPLESTEGNTMIIPGHAINVMTGQYYDTSMVLMMGGCYVVYIVGDVEAIGSIQKVLSDSESGDANDLKTIPELIEIYPSKGFLGREVKYGRC